MTSFRSTIFALLVSVVATAAFVGPSAGRTQSQLRESFGFDFAEDTYANQPDFLKGEGEYKTWIGKTKENSFVNRQVGSRKRPCYSGLRIGGVSLAALVFSPF